MVMYLMGEPASEHQRGPYVTLAAKPDPGPLAGVDACQDPLDETGTLLGLRQHRRGICVPVGAKLSQLSESAHASNLALVSKARCGQPTAAIEEFDLRLGR